MVGDRLAVRERRHAPSVQEETWLSCPVSLPVGGGRVRNFGSFWQSVSWHWQQVCGSMGYTDDSQLLLRHHDIAG